MKNAGLKLYPTDFVVITAANEPLRYDSGEIGLWAKETIRNDELYPDDLKEIPLIEGEIFLPSNELCEPYKSELIEQINREKS